MFPHPSTIKREQNIFPLRMSLIENIKNRRPNIDISYLSCMLHLSVTDAVEPDPVDFFHSPSENLGSPVTGKMFNDLQIQEMRMMDKGSRFILSFSFSKQFFFLVFCAYLFHFNTRFHFSLRSAKRSLVAIAISFY